MTDYLRFKTDPAVREEYINAFGTIRISKILEDLDALAGSIAYLHADDGNKDTVPPTIVTASVDRIDMLQRIPPDQDIRMSGFVTFVGSSSLEVSITVDSLPTGAPPPGSENVLPENIESNPILAAKFIMVARDPVTGKAAQINGLKLETDEERRLFQSGAEAKARKQVAASTALTKLPPSVEEMVLVHDLHLQSKKFSDQKPENVIFMDETEISKVVICHPSERNIHGNVFGGFLMQSAYELAFANALIFARSAPFFICLDDISFLRPVHIGALLSMSSLVVYSPGAPSRSFQIKVKIDIIDPLQGTRDTSNEFHLTFGVAKDSASPLKAVIPQSYDEAMVFLEGRRRRKRWLVAAAHNTATLKGQGRKNIVGEEMLGVEDDIAKRV
ncbi:hypothetical protein SmJEL517_g04913 [Synchytrium microbalum]|uniref:HotDog ACOT-type domain-containing protein n=1 Tax=Synchytrium microbalum TaxID=1806994 RepID=A0A507C1B3_9FUNG|nr:uncharacterized protein SmJEL517_g04913 [Synchytrium microbalum]TPX31854.1 hypothetical protein SmJEL517_g04913 [Synchytrium microbalum]